MRELVYTVGLLSLLTLACGDHSPYNAPGSAGNVSGDCLGDLDCGDGEICVNDGCYNASSAPGNPCADTLDCVMECSPMDLCECHAGRCFIQDSSTSCTTSDTCNDGYCDFAEVCWYPFQGGA